MVVFYIIYVNRIACEGGPDNFCDNLYIYR